MISTTTALLLLLLLLLLLIFSLIPLSFSQGASPNFLIGVSPDTIEPGKSVSVRVSGLMQPNSTKDVVVIFIPPLGDVQQHQIHLQGGPLGFANVIIDYPKGVANASSNVSGNYTILFQDVGTGMLKEMASFEVTEPISSFSYLSSIPLAILIPATITVSGVILTLIYNHFSTKRQFKVALIQKKAEHFLALKPHFTQSLSSVKQMVKLLEELRVSDVGLIETQINYQLCFYHLVLFLREDIALREKTGAYFLNDSRGELLLSLIRTEIMNRLKTEFGQLGFDELSHILSSGQTFRDLEAQLRSTSISRQLYDHFVNWIGNRQEDSDITQLIFDLNFFLTVLDYEHHKLFTDWYERRKKEEIGLSQSLKEQIHSYLKADSRYNKFTHEYP